MITEHDLQEAIAECNGKRNPDASTCLKLAAYYTIREHLYPATGADAVESALPAPVRGYSYAEAPQTARRLDSGTEFSKAISGKPDAVIWPVIDELASTLQVLYPKLYAAFMRKIADA